MTPKLNYWFTVGALALVTLVLSPSAKAQVALGLRFGEPSGLDARFGMGKTNALNVAFGYNYRNRDRWSAGAMVAYHWIKDTRSPGLKWYYGVAGLVSSRTYRTYRWWREEDEARFVALTLAIPVGLQYDFNGAPIQLFGEVLPGADILPGDLYLGASIGIRLQLDKL